MHDMKCAGDFRSDNVAGVSPTIMAAIVAANEGTAASYGDDEVSFAVNKRYSALFGTPVTVFPVSTGTAANAISLAAGVRPYGGIFCRAAAENLTQTLVPTDPWYGSTSSGTVMSQVDASLKVRSLL